MDNHTILKLLSNYAETTPYDVAIFCQDESPITYQQLLNSIAKIADKLIREGIEKEDRVALVLRDGPEMATLFLTVSGISTCAPLNPKYTFKEFKFYFSDLKAKVILLEDGNTQAIEAAQELGVKIIVLSELLPMWVSNDPLNNYYWENLIPKLTHSDDTALVLHTSGTTAKPKIVPLTHRNLTYSMQNIAKSLKLTKADRCMNIMPLFHIHGLVGGLLSSLASGGSVVCNRGFEPESFYNGLAEFSPTWYSAVPTMHQAILTQGKNIKMNHSLRFIRSSSASLPPQVSVELEGFFEVPVVEAYGMTEAAHQMAINPFPPRKRKTRSVGRAAGCEIAIMDQQNNIVAPESLGEIVIRGENVIKGYENNPVANQNSFSLGWFRTGDQGYLDLEGYLFIDSRIKELINRGGEKISPREIDDVILSHPAVLQVAAFAYPHPTLGEDIAAVIVKKPEKEVTEKEIRQFAAISLASFKIPSKVIFAKEIPKGPTGKIQRIGLAGKLGIIADVSDNKEYQPPTNAEEITISRIWEEVLEVENISIDEDFFNLGGNSIQVMRILARIQENTGILLTFEEFFNNFTIAELSLLVQQHKVLVTPK
ncbi:MAG: AMP-binding protein [Bacillus sp. (in: Bacteria)]|nr:AMP-binding protein [Bacillus sp. (in: firmicutes)]